MTDDEQIKLTRREDAVTDKGAFRASTRFSIGNDEVHIVKFDPVDSDPNWLFMEVPSIQGPQADIDAWEGAVLSVSSTLSTQHNINYAGQETPNTAVVEATSNGALDTSGAEQTEETQIPPNGTGYKDSQSAEGRAWWRVVPPTEDVTVRVTNQSGAAKFYAMNFVFHERSDWANRDLL